MTLDLSQFKPDQLSRGALFSGSVSMDWQELYRNDECYDGITVEYPPVTADVLDDYWPDWREEYPLSEYEGDEDEQLEQAIEGFQQDCAGHEWENSYFPVMNYGYPVDIRHGPSCEEIAQNLDNLAGCVSLVRHDDRYYLALTGGGMDLSWNICAAFIVCGCIPPINFLNRLPRMASSGKYPANIPDEIAKLVVDCIPVAAESLRTAAYQLEREHTELLTH
ncbi:MAG: hypothetical protein AAF468_20115 [Pseudomonadota bacterium]